MIKYFSINNFYTKGIQYNGIKALLNHLCGIKNDSLIDTDFTLGILNDNGTLKIYVSMDDTFENILQEKLKLIYQNIEFDEFNIDQIRSKLTTNTSRFGTMKLKYKSNKQIANVEPKPTFMSNLLNALYSKSNHDVNLLEIKLQPILVGSNTKNKQSNEVKKKILNGLIKSSIFVIESMFPSTDLTSKNTNNVKTNVKENNVNVDAIKFEYNVSINFATSSSDMNITQHDLTIKLRNIASIFSELNNSNIFYYETVEQHYMFNANSYNMKLSSDEVCQFVYLPDESMMSSILGAADTKILIEKSIPNSGIYIGDQMNNTAVCLPTPNDILTVNKYKDIYFKLSTITTTDPNKVFEDIKNSQIIDNLVKHRLIMGGQGSGKSEFVTTLAINGLKRGVPFILMDPKFDTQKRLIESIPDEYIDSIEFLDLGDLLYPPALNIFRKRKDNDPTENSLIVTSFISYMKKQFDRSWGYNIERTLQMTTDAILLDDTSTMSEFYFMLTEQTYRQAIIEVIKAKLSEPHVDNKSRLKQLLKYWSDYEARYEKNPISTNKEIEPIMNKIGSFIGNRFINAIVSQRESYDFKKAGDTGKSVIINIPEGIINQDNMALLSGFISKAIWADYQSRDDTEMAKRYPVQWLIDEAHTMIDSEIVGIMQKARSRRLGLNLITQTLASLDMRGTKISDIIMDNCKTKLIFKIGYVDARILCDEFAPLTTKDLSDCPDYHYYGRILLPNGTISKPFYAHAPMPAPVLRNYDNYKENHRSGKLTIGQIEDDIEDRLERFKIANELIE